MAPEKKRGTIKTRNGKQTKKQKRDDGEKTKGSVTDKNKAVSPGIVSNPDNGSEKKGATTFSQEPNKVQAGSKSMTFSLKHGISLEGVPKEVDCLGTGATESSMVSSELPCREWFHKIQEKTTGGSIKIYEADLVEYVRNQLFRSWKFFTHKKQLTFADEKGTICQFILSAMNVKEKYKMTWWNNYSIKILKTLNEKRSDVTSAIKKAFMGKSYFGNTTA
jgi:hypothetical protein